MTNFYKFTYIIVIAVLAASNVNDAFAKKKRKRYYYQPLKSSIVVNAENGEIQHDENAKTKIFPASLTKLMTLYLTFEAIEAKKLKINEKLLVSRKATKMPPAKLHLKAGETITVKEAIMALIVKSANDVAVVLAERLSGNEVKFATQMNNCAYDLGMHNTYFHNSSGWHNKDQTTTALDLAKLAIALKRDYAKYYSLFAQTRFKFRGRIYHSHNNITSKYPGAEGLKTGYTVPSGYNLITAANNKGKNLVAVVTGSPSALHRDTAMNNLLNKYFNINHKIETVSNKVKARFKKKKPINKTQKISKFKPQINKSSSQKAHVKKTANAKKTKLGKARIVPNKKVYRPKAVTKKLRKINIKNRK